MKKLISVLLLLVALLGLLLSAAMIFLNTDGAQEQLYQTMVFTAIFFALTRAVFLTIKANLEGLTIPISWSSQNSLSQFGLLCPLFLASPKSPFSFLIQPSTSRP